MLFDYAMAFPSVCHAWVFFFLDFFGMPVGSVDAIKALYKMNRAYMSSPNGIILMFVILFGVLQGCPLSGSLFVIAIDPLLHMFKTMLENSNLAWVRACADDIGISLSQLRHLSIVRLLLGDFTVVSGLNLKFIKCVVIRNALLASGGNGLVVKEWLRKLFCVGVHVCR